MAKRTQPLGEMANVTSGYTFRGAIQSLEEGIARVIQMSDVAPDAPIQWDRLTRTNLPGKRSPNWLRTDDIILVARGWQNFALHLPEVPMAVVCSPHFAVIRLHHPTLSPAFVAWQLNQPPLQAYLDTIATGTTQRSIPISGLRSAPIVALSTAAQAHIIALHEAYKRERVVYQALIANREREMQALAHQFLSKEPLQ